MPMVRVSNGGSVPQQFILYGGASNYKITTNSSITFSGGVDWTVIATTKGFTKYRFSHSIFSSNGVCVIYNDLSSSHLGAKNNNTVYDIPANAMFIIVGNSGASGSATIKFELLN